MHDLTKIVVPKIMHKWEYIAAALHYDLPVIEAIKIKKHYDPRECCREFFRDWLLTNNGARAGPKVWSTLFDALNDVDNIAADITQNIILEAKQLK